ncbi:MAG: response regulator [Gemmatimonadetes bacterium]|nr:response regulator [Gemmatimonadota bacterium]
MAARILLVDDNEDSRTVYRLILEHGGYEVLEAATGPDALTRARENQPDLILMDISIPVLDGWEATRILKADERTRRIPVIALTAHALETDRARAVEVGCDGYLAKPAAPTLVMATIQSRLGLPGTITT